MVAQATHSKLKFVPLNDNVLIEELPREQGLIVIPDNSEIGPPYGRVVAFGDYVPMGVEEGDIVSMFSDYPFIEVLLGGKVYKMTRAAYLKCKVKGLE